MSNGPVPGGVNDEAAETSEAGDSMENTPNPESEIPHPPVVDRPTWQAERDSLLVREKELTRLHDQVNAARRRLPMVRVDNDYRFETEAGTKSFAELFGGKRQLIVYHFMFDPEWEDGCPGCTSWVDALGDLSMLGERNTAFTLVSRAPIAKLLDYRQRRGWGIPWASSFGSQFNQDFGFTDERGESPGLSVFFRLGETVHLTWQTRNRGVESLTDAYPLLDTTPYGRQEDFEDSPPGWPQRPTYG